MSGTSIALGYFDGVHLGHRSILKQTVDIAKGAGLQSAAFTFYFDTHRTKAPDILTLTERKRRILQQGVAQIFCPSFAEISSLSPQQFVREFLAGQCKAKAVCCGENFRFGAGGAGDVHMLQCFCDELGIQSYVLPLCRQDGLSVSATRIRSLIGAGEIQQANTLLGQPYVVDLPVQHGKQLGSSIGFPTVNQIYPDTMQQPAQGVWRTAVQIDGVWYPAATGIGSRPTVNQNAISVTCESFICNWQGYAYGTSPRVAFLEYLWPVRRYDSLQELQQCIGQAAQLSCQRFDPTILQ